jgi:hypothetical protein
MSRHTFGLMHCRCGQRVGGGGRARASHMMAHVRRGDCVHAGRLTGTGHWSKFEWLVKYPKPINPKKACL